MSRGSARFLAGKVSSGDGDFDGAFADRARHAQNAPMLSIGIDVGGTSVKVAALRNGQVMATSRSSKYVGPNAREFVAAIREACRDLPRPIDRIGMCVPGILDEKQERILYSANLSNLANVKLVDLVGAALGPETPAPVVANDSIATAFDIYASRQIRGRLLVIALGTGVGAAVLDDGTPLSVDGDSPGHIGQFDVSVEGAPVVGPDGGRGSLEGYIGAAALQQRYGADPAAKIKPEDAAFRALVRAIRICQAIYRPSHVCLAGGVGIRLGYLIDDLKKSVDCDLTRVARPDWTLSTGDNDFHAAVGAARIAARDA